MIKKRVYDATFKKMSVVLSDTKGSVKEAAEELDIDPGRISIVIKKIFDIAKQKRNLLG